MKTFLKYAGTPLLVTFAALQMAAYGLIYNIEDHPCCQDEDAAGNKNLTLAMVIDPFDIYGHDPTDKLDHLLHYQTRMLKIRNASNQSMINAHVEIASIHLHKFTMLHVKELKVLLIAVEDAIDNMLTMYEHHNAIKTDRSNAFNADLGITVPSEFYMSQEYYCGKSTYIFLSDHFSDIYNLGKGISPYCQGRSFHFLDFVHYLGDDKYFVVDDPSVAFTTDNYMHGLECHLDVCIYRFPFKKLIQTAQDIPTLPKAIVKCGITLYKLPPLTATACIITSGTFILDFNIHGLRYRHHENLLTIPNGYTYYTKEADTPLVCDHHVCEWNYTNFYGGPIVIPGTDDDDAVTVIIEPTTTVPPPPPTTNFPPIPIDIKNRTSEDQCWLLFPPNYGSITGISYLDPMVMHEYRYTCSPMNGGRSRALYWYPQWMGAPPYHPYPHPGDSENEDIVIRGDAYHPHVEEPPIELSRGMFGN